MPVVGTGVKRKYHDPMRTPDVLVIGGGIIGLTSAYYLAKEGLSVEVIDRGELGREASWAGAGIIPPGHFPNLTTTPLDHLRAASAYAFRSFSADLRDGTGIDNEFHFCGGVEFLAEAELELLDLWDRELVSYKRLSDSLPGPVRTGFNRVEGRIPFFLPEMAQLRNPRHLAALIATCRLLGVGLQPSTPFGWWEREGESPIALTTDGTRRPAGKYLVAAGAWAEEVLQPLGCRLGVAPVRGQIVLFNPGRRLFRPILIVGKRYLVPRKDGHVLIGSTEEPEAGFEKANTPEGVRGLIDFAFELVPALRDAPVEKTWAGLRPGSPDEMPFIGPVPGVANVFAAVGHFRSGIQLSIGTAELVRDLILDRPPALPANAFRLDRVPDRTARPAFRS